MRLNRLGSGTTSCSLPVTATDASEKRPQQQVTPLVGVAEGGPEAVGSGPKRLVERVNEEIPVDNPVTITTATDTTN
jgi:hypothetical protein